MMAKDSVKKRLEGETGMSFTEFSYQLVQGYDFYYLWKHHNCVIQMGGSDQWGNIVTGTELIRRKDQGTAYAITTQLIKKADGTKFGKTESGAIWLDPEKTSPYKFYQFWLNSSDDDVKKWIRIFTLKSKEDIESLEIEHNNAPHLRILQKALADDITIRTHSAVALETAIKTSEFLFGNGALAFLQTLDTKSVMEMFEGVPQFNISKTELAEGIDVATLLAEKTTIFPSKGEVKKTIQGGGLSVNKTKVLEITSTYDVNDLINHQFIVVQKGKKNYFLLIAE
jgi:tyrosyl-tRNA synthetase